jgi:RNA polymerase-associated protein CTR9
MHIHKGETSKAIICFENVLKAYPENYESLKVLGSLYASTNKKERAFIYLKRATELHPDDPETWVELAQLLEIDNYHDALDGT